MTQAQLSIPGRVGRSWQRRVRALTQTPWGPSSPWSRRSSTRQLIHLNFLSILYPQFLSYVILVFKKGLFADPPIFSRDLQCQRESPSEFPDTTLRLFIYLKVFTRFQNLNIDCHIFNVTYLNVEHVYHSHTPEENYTNTTNILKAFCTPVSAFCDDWHALKVLNTT